MINSAIPLELEFGTCNLCLGSHEMYAGLELEHIWVCIFWGDQLQVRLGSSTLAKQTPETDLRNRPLRQTSRPGHLILRHTHIYPCLEGASTATSREGESRGLQVPYDCLMGHLANII